MGVTEYVEYIRENFEKKYAENIASGMYDARDLERLQNDFTFARSYIRGKDRLDEGVELLHTSFKFRKENAVNDLCEDSFDKELFELGGMFFHNRDVNRNRILWLRVKIHRKDASPDRLAMEKKGLIFALEKAFNEAPLHQVVVLLDMTSCGLVNLDMDFVKYIITLFKYHYPTFLAYMLIYDMPWIFNAAWRVIKAWLSAEAAAKIKFVTKADIQTYIKTEDLPTYMGGTEDFVYEYKPGMASLPLYPTEDNDDKKKDKKVHFQEVQEYNHTNSSSPPDSPTTSNSDSSPVDFNANSPDSTDGLRRRTYSNESNNREPNRNNNAGKRSLVLGRSQPSSGVSATVGGLLTVSPANELIFAPKDEGDAFDTLTLTSAAKTPVAYKIKTTSPEKFRVRPSAGILKPEASEEIYVYLVPEFKEDVTKDKFLIMAVDAPKKEGLDPNVLFKEAAKGTVHQHKLMCSLGKKNVPKSKDGGAAAGTPMGAVSKKVEQLETQTRHMQKQLNLLLVIQFLTAFTLILVMLSYSCFGEELFTHFLSLPFDFCNDPYGRKC